MDVRIYGASDDLVEVEYVVQGDEKTPKPLELSYRDKPLTLNIGSKLLAILKYNGVWSIEVSQIDEDVQIPNDWLISLGVNNNGYSMELLIEDVEPDIRVFEVVTSND